MRFITLFACFYLAASALPAQTPNTWTATRLDAVPVIDGFLDDSCWQVLPAMDSFTTSTPVFGATPRCRTIVRLFYTETALYVAAYCVYADGRGIRRDGNARDGAITGDWFRVSLDTWNDDQLSFDFTVSAAGVQSDSRQNNPNWDTWWQSAVAPLPKGWSVEICIPFTALRFPPGRAEHTWGLQLSQYNRSAGQLCTWSPQDPLVSDRALQFGTLTGLRDIRQVRRRSLSAFSRTTLHTKTGLFFDGNSGWQTLGLDGRWGLNESSTLDFTLLPPGATRFFDGSLQPFNPFRKRIVGNAELPEPRQLLAEESDLFGRGTALNPNPVVYGGNLIWRLLPLDSGAYVARPTKSNLLQATKLTARSKGNWRFGVYNAVLGPVKADVFPGVGNLNEFHTETLQAVSDYNFFSAEYVLPNTGYLNFSNATLLAGRNTNSFLPSANFRLRDRSNSYELSGGGYLGYHQFDTSRQTGGAYSIRIARVNRRWGWDINHLENGNTYFPYLLPAPNSIQLFRSQSSANLTFQTYTPKGPFLNISGRAGVSLVRSWTTNTPDSWLLQAFGQALDRHFWRYQLQLNSIPYRRIQRYENRGAYLSQRLSPTIGGSLSVTSDSRKRFYVQTGVSAEAGLKGEFPHLSASAKPFWVLNHWLTLQVSLQSTGYLKLLELLNEPGRWLFGQRDSWLHSAGLQGSVFPLKNLQVSAGANLNWRYYTNQEVVELQPDGALVPVGPSDNPISNDFFGTVTIDLQYFFSSISQVRLKQTFTPGDSLHLYKTPDGYDLYKGTATELSVVYLLGR